MKLKYGIILQKGEFDIVKLLRVEMPNIGYVILPIPLASKEYWRSIVKQLHKYLPFKKEERNAIIGALGSIIAKVNKQLYGIHRVVF